MGKIQIEMPGGKWAQLSCSLRECSGCNSIAESKSGSNSTHFFTVLVEEVWLALEKDGNPCLEIGDQIPERFKLILIPSAFPNGSLEQLGSVFCLRYLNSLLPKPLDPSMQAHSWKSGAVVFSHAGPKHCLCPEQNICLYLCKCLALHGLCLLTLISAAKNNNMGIVTFMCSIHITSVTPCWNLWSKTVGNVFTPARNRQDIYFWKNPFAFRILSNCCLLAWYPVFDSAWNTVYNTGIFILSHIWSVLWFCYRKFLCLFSGEYEIGDFWRSEGPSVSNYFWNSTSALP